MVDYAGIYCKYGRQRFKLWLSHTCNLEMGRSTQMATTSDACCDEVSVVCSTSSCLVVSSLIYTCLLLGCVAAGKQTASGID